MNRFQIALALALAPALLAATPPVAALPTTPAASLQGDKKAPPKDDPEVDGLIKTLTEITRGKADRDSEGAQILDQLSSKYSSLNDKQKKKVEKAVAASFRARREPNEVVLYIAAGEALSRFGKAGADALAKVVNDRRFKNEKEWSAFRSQMVRLLGRPAEDKYIKTLIDIALKDNDDQARAKAGEALGDYAKHDQKVRKQIVERLVKGLEEVYAQANVNIDPNDLARKTWVDRYAAIQDPWMKTLTKLTGQRIQDVQKWTAWWNDNKRENWDKDKK